MYPCYSTDLSEPVPWLDDLARVCLSLEHLVYHTHYALPLPRLPSHPMLAYIDSCLHFPTLMEETITSEARWKKPRLLDDTLRIIPQLPELFPPSAPPRSYQVACTPYPTPVSHKLHTGYVATT